MYAHFRPYAQIPALSLYSLYCRNFDTATETLRQLAKQETFTQFLQRLGNATEDVANRQSCFQLENFLIMPGMEIPCEDVV